MQLISERRTFASPSGAQLNVRIRRSEGKPRGVVQINHGLAEHSGRYERFCDFLADHGFDSYVHDHRGHGYTKAPNAPLGRFGKPDGGDEVIADVAAMHWLIADGEPGLPDQDGHLPAMVHLMTQHHFECETVLPLLAVHVTFGE